MLNNIIIFDDEKVTIKIRYFFMIGLIIVWTMRISVNMCVIRILKWVNQIFSSCECEVLFLFRLMVWLLRNEIRLFCIVKIAELLWDHFGYFVWVVWKTLFDYVLRPDWHRLNNNFQDIILISCDCWKNSIDWALTHCETTYSLF